MCARNRILAAVAALLAGASATAASAGNVLVSNVGFTGDSVDVSGFVNWTGVNSGLITLTTTTNNIIPVFCIDLFHTIGVGSQIPPLPYTFGTIVADSSSSPAGTGGNPLSQPTTGEIQTLANIGYYDFVHGTGTADIYAGLQGAIWSIEYNTNGNSLTVNGSSTVNDLIAGYIAYAEAHPAPYSVSMFPGANGQAFGNGQGFTTGVPEPSTWAMMLAGFAALSFAGYRTAKAKAAAA